VIHIHHTNIYKIYDYSLHLKNLPQEDKINRFGYNASDHAIDQMILQMAYNPNQHELWYARGDNDRLGWGHMALNNDNTWELALSVNVDSRGQGIGSMLITEMIEFAKVNHIEAVYMHCIESNKVVQHLARKHNLKTVDFSQGEKTAQLTVPDANLFEISAHKMKEQALLVKQISVLQKRLTNLWTTL
jgi:GNAT superfamily N-acetyltransferase